MLLPEMVARGHEGVNLYVSGWDRLGNGVRTDFKSRGRVSTWMLDPAEQDRRKGEE